MKNAGTVRTRTFRTPSKNIIYNIKLALNLHSNTKSINN
jgi:hypothetical protein